MSRGTDWYLPIFWFGPIFKAAAVFGLPGDRRWDWMGVPKISVTTNLCCVTSHNREDLIYTTEDVWNNAYITHIGQSM